MDDKQYMKQALREAQKGYDEGEVPVGRVAVERLVVAVESSLWEAVLLWVTATHRSLGWRLSCCCHLPLGLRLSGNWYGLTFQTHRCRPLGI